MAEQFPSQFQELLNESGFSQTMGDTKLVSDMDIGLPKERARFTEGIDGFSCSIDIKISEYLILENFYKTTLGNGVRYFLYNHPYTQIEREWKFNGPPQITPLGGEYLRVTMNWQLIP